MKGALSQSAQTSHTQLAHALVQYFGVEAPTDLEKYGIRSAGDLVDLISKVSHPNTPIRPVFHNLRSQVLDEHTYPHDSKPNSDWACSLARFVAV